MPACASTADRHADRQKHFFRGVGRTAILDTDVHSFLNYVFFTQPVEAALYYQSQATRLGVDFLYEVERAVKSIAESPNTWQILEGELRRRLIRRFPFGILYKVEPEEIVVIAVAHLRRKPGYWKERIQKT